MDYLEHVDQRLKGKEAFVPALLGRKERVRDFARTIGVRTPEVFYRGPIGALPEALPDQFVLKPEFASTSIGVRLLRVVDGSRLLDLVAEKEVQRDDLVRQCEEIASRFYEDRHVDAIFVVEQLLCAPDGTFPPPDIRCYSFQGEIGMILVEHHIAGPARAMYFDGGFHPFNDLDERYGVAPGAHDRETIVPAVAPANAREILNVARRISTAVPSAFVRVDLYDTPEGVYLGELTFFPGTFYYANRKLMHPLESERLGRYWDAAAERLAGSLSTR